MVELAEPVDDFVEVGVVAAAYGVRGWVKVRPYAKLERDGGALFATKSWRLTNPPQACAVAVRNIKQHGGAIIAQFAGCSNRDTALARVGWRIMIKRADFPALSENEYYWVDLLGLKVVNPAGITLGTVGALMDNGAHAILRVIEPEQDTKRGTADMPMRRERLIPFVGAYIDRVDRAGRRIVVDWQDED